MLIRRGRLRIGQLYPPRPNFPLCVESEQAFRCRSKASIFTELNALRHCSWRDATTIRSHYSRLSLYRRPNSFCWPRIKDDPQQRGIVILQFLTGAKVGEGRPHPRQWPLRQWAELQSSCAGFRMILVITVVTRDRTLNLRSSSELLSFFLSLSFVWNIQLQKILQFYPIFIFFSNLLSFSKRYNINFRMYLHDAVM